MQCLALTMKQRKGKKVCVRKKLIEEPLISAVTRGCDAWVKIKNGALKGFVLRFKRLPS